MIVVDVQALQMVSYARRGVGRVVADLGRSLADLDLVDAFVWNDRLARGAVLDEFGSDVGDRLVAATELRGRHIDVLHDPAPFAPLGRSSGDLVDLLDTAVPVHAGARVVTLHDVIPWTFPDRYLADPGDRARYTSRLAGLLTADVVAATGAAVANDAVEVVGCPARRVEVCGIGVGAPFDGSAQNEPGTDPATTWGLDAPYVFVPAAPEWRKNVDGAIRAFGRLPSALRSSHLLVTGLTPRASDHALMRAWADDAGVADRLRLVGEISDLELADLYRHARLVVFPSFAEGFGLPIAEARAVGAPVVCSDRAPMTEALPEPAAWFDPTVDDSVCAAIERALVDDQHRRELASAVRPDTSWEMVAQRYAAVYDRLSPIRADRRSAPPSRVGLVSILPPSTSGIANHSEHLLEAMLEQSDIDVTAFVPHPPARLPRLPDADVRPLATLVQDWEAGRLDAVIAAVGNGSEHRPVLDAIRSVPSSVLVHDVAMPFASHGGDDVDAAVTVAESAVAVFVQTRHAARMFEALAGRSPIDVGPHPCWNDRGVLNAPDPDDPVVVTMGIAHETKRTDVFVAAAAGFGEGVQAAIVGAGGERFVGDGAPVLATGYADDRSFDAWLQRAWVAVQLRASSNGESSGAVAHCLARGVATIVSDVGAMSELPDDIVVKVSPDIDAEGLAAVVRSLVADPVRRHDLSEAARGFARRETAGVQVDRLMAIVRDRVVPT